MLVDVGNAQQEVMEEVAAGLQLLDKYKTSVSKDGEPRSFCVCGA